MTRHVRCARPVVLAVVVAITSLAAFADSHVRIVRLSSVEGQVQIDRAAGQGLERAILNTPIVEGTRLITGNDGLAEVEFENQSALRLTENSEVKFSQLLMNDAGSKINQMRVEKGIVYLDTASKGEDSYLLSIGDKTTMMIGRDTLARISADPDQLKVAVFKGEVRLEGEAQLVVVRKKETLTVDLKKASDYTVANGIEEVRFDRWNKEREDYSRTYAENEGYGGPSRAYGLQDLNYYGDFFYANGYGYVWQPYGFANSMVGWNPYSNGAWMFYPGAGYSWASAYPWGWLPYHYGSWAFIGGAGWAWVPGHFPAQFTNAYQSIPRIAKAPKGWTAPAPPTTTAMVKSAPTVLVGQAARAPLSIPGGRIPPNFGSMVPGRSVAVAGAHGFVSPSTTSAGRSVLANSENGITAMHHGSGHVFAQPVATSIFMEEPGFTQAYGGAGKTASPVGSVHGAGSASAGSASSASAPHK